MRIDLIKLHAQDLLIAAQALQTELRRLDTFDAIPEEDRAHIAHLCRRGAHIAVGTAASIQPRAPRG